MFRNVGVNDLLVRGIYPTASGASLGTRSTSLTPWTLDNTEGDEMRSGAIGEGGEVEGDKGAAPVARGGIIGQPLSWWFVLVAMLFGLMFAAKRLGAGEEFRNVKMSVYNVVVISLAAIVGIGFFKVVFNRWKVPGLTTFVNAV